jgi:hypothetical protein
MGVVVEGETSLGKLSLKKWCWWWWFGEKRLSHARVGGILDGIFMLGRKV